LDRHQIRSLIRTTIQAMSSISIRKIMRDAKKLIARGKFTANTFMSMMWAKSMA
jgi:hypothetical protein